MTYEEALELIRIEYETQKDSKHAEIIYTGLTYDGCNGFCVALYNNGDELILTDFGETKEIFDEVEEKQWIELCSEHGFEFRHWRIVRRFTSLRDVEEFIEFLDFISEEFR